MTTTSKERRFFLPLVDTNATPTFGLALLKAILLGYQIAITDAELHRAMAGVAQPDAPTGLQQIAQRLGLQLELLLLPTDQLCLPAVLPALVMMRPIAEEAPHWTVIWQQVGAFHQVLDPKLQRRWLQPAQLLAEAQDDVFTLTAEEWRTVATTATSRHFLQARLNALDVAADEQTILLEAAYTPGNELGPAVLDAALRTVEHVVQRGGFRRGREAGKAVAHHFAHGLTLLHERRQLLAPANWAILPELTATDLRQAPVTLHGVVVLRIIGLTAARAAALTAARATPTKVSRAAAPAVNAAAPPATVTSTPTTEKPTVLTYLRAEAWPVAVVIGLAMLLAGAGLFFQAVIFRSLAQLSLDLLSFERRLWAIGLLLLFTLTMTGLKWFSHSTVQRLGHRLDGRLRIAVLSQLPRLSSHYFQQIAAGDMIERIHNLRAIRKLPFYLSEFLHLFFQFLMTVVGLLLLDWVSALITFIKLLIPFFFFYIDGYIGSESVRTRTYLGFLSRFYLDAMQGLVAIRTHGAEQTTRRAYEDLLGKWVKSSINVYQGEWRNNVIATALSYSLTALIIVLYVLRGKEPANLLLIAYWSISLESLRGPLLFLATSYLFDQGKVNRFLQLFDAPLEETLVGGTSQPQVDAPVISAPLAAAQDVDPSEMNATGSDSTTANPSLRSSRVRTKAKQPAPPTVAQGLAITMQQVTVMAGKQQILKAVDLEIPAGSQIGIVGPSGAGKSTLVGLLLGWHYPAAGQILIDGETLDYARLCQLRAETAWVDPTIQLWNRSFLYNLRYGGSRMPLNQVLEQADLHSVLERMPDGMQTKLGGEGRLVSGGEGQRMRFGRSLQRPEARLVILDEPFRGLDRAQRRTLLANARAYWPQATLLCITHDVGQTEDFARVVVIEEGRIIEDGTPQALLARPDSRYRALLDAENAVRKNLWASTNWRRLWLENGQVQERQ